MNIQTLAWVFAVAFLLIGALGFVPGVTTDGQLLGVFKVGTLNNIVYLASGLLAAFAAASSLSTSRIYFKIFGVLYAIGAIAGLVQGSTMLGFLEVNMADNILHLVVAAAALEFYE